MMETMRKYLDEQGRKSEITSRLLEIKALEETPELRAERETLTKKQGEVEIAFRKALAEVRVEEEQTVTTFDTEELELRQLEQKASMGDIAAGVLTQHACEGASRELQQHHHLKPNQVPCRCCGPRSWKSVPPGSHLDPPMRARISGLSFPLSFLSRSRPSLGSPGKAWAWASRLSP